MVSSTSGNRKKIGGIFFAQQYAYHSNHTVVGLSLAVYKKAMVGWNHHKQQIGECKSRRYIWPVLDAK